MQFDKKIALQEPLQELLFIQNQLCQPSKYYGTLLQQRLGTDTIPFLVITVEGEILFVNKTCFFRIEAVEDHQITVLLLQAYTADNEEALSVKEALYIKKTAIKAVLPLHGMAAIQLIDLPFEHELSSMETKW
ncbi:MAG: hypothetical protein ABS949_08410 [Solibacillus sp.]